MQFEVWVIYHRALANYQYVVDRGYIAENVKGIAVFHPGAEHDMMELELEPSNEH